MTGSDSGSSGATDVLVGESAPVPFVDLDWLHSSMRDEIDQALAGVIGRSDFILGSAVADFEQAFARKCGVGFGVGVDSGYSAIELALRALGVGHGDQVITAANTFVATVGAIEACGATPVLVDVDPATANIDVDKLAGAIGTATRAVIPVHLYGRMAPMREIDELARERGVLVVEDACQAHGASLESRPAGAWGHASAFSFYPGKNLGALGDGGAVVTDDPAIDDVLRKLRNLGSVVKYQHEIKGFNRRLDTMHAAVLLAKLARLDHHNDMRRHVARRYVDSLAEAPVVLPSLPVDPHEHVYHLFVIETDRRDELIDFLRARDIASGIHYPVPIHLQPPYRSLGDPGAFPVSEQLARRIVSLPIFPGMTDATVDRVAQAVIDFHGGTAWS